ncbi:pro-resilin-like [Penaeus japonicus]|uniref:pro-resilin-like n=1 Tax=Penaeus japonicus TaxID=27405 RepID=UPI001C7174B0|nr:pro-resilin-like [Penaeus japonicus]
MKPLPLMLEYIRRRRKKFFIISIESPNMFTRIIVTLGLVAASLAAPSQPSYGYSPPPSYQSPAQYNFDWLVKDDYSGNDYGHQESRDGYNTQGTYYVQLPDGRLQKVTYYVDGDSGYVAEVSYEGEAQYQAHQPSYHPTPSYHTTPSYHPTPAYRPTPSYRPRPHH